MADACADLIDCIRKLVAASLEEDRVAFAAAKARLLNTTKMALDAANAFTRARDGQGCSADQRRSPRR